MSRRMEFPCMGTVFSIEADNPEALEKWFHRAEAKYSRFIKSSEVSHLNDQTVSNTWLDVSEEFYFILKEMDKYKSLTQSLFNPYLGAHIKALGYEHSFSRIKNSSFQPYTPFVHGESILFHPSQPKVKKIANMEIDPGGFVKGWSADQGFLLAQGEECVINAGGDMRFRFLKPQVIGITNPFDFETDIARITLQAGALATSSVKYRRWKTLDGEKHHLLNGQTGKNPVSDVVQTTVFAPSAPEAEVFAKVLCMMNATESMEWLKKHRPALACILIANDYSIFTSDTIDNYCEGVETAWTSQPGNGQEFQG
ncbi:FAD:protein FMN transferase [Halobacillus salinarum]|uniref:FAD:protein FMN transferase n=1 Tax=Halobacillus salinarum TaxID=2932257 RepID=A0ABY4EKP7_9BACI|nr:FAD:protein FMN transferase [Halobacillus salinarum]UOQ44555.1 FAD:protein FMN transferase [Halobacillus salinarum]